MKQKQHYYASAINDQGASLDIGHASSVNDLARRTLGSGWTVHITRVDIDGDGYSILGHTEVKTFRVR